MNKYKVLAITLVLSAAIGIGSISAYSQNTRPYTAAPVANQVQYTNVNALELVANPSRYLYRNVRIRAKFDKFSTLGLDYPPVNRPHEKYISFLIQRPDITNHNIPLSELKIFLKKDVAEKNIDLDAGDEIEFSGKVFSIALGDPWMYVTDFKVVNKVKKEDKK